MPEKHQALTSTIRELKGFGVVPAIGPQLSSQRDAVIADLSAKCLSHVGAYRKSHNPDVLPELDAHLADHGAAVCSLLAGESRELDFVAEHARKLAEQKFPLDAILDTYRWLQRMLNDWVRDAALELADQQSELRRVVAAAASFAIEYVGACSSLATTEYVEATRRLAEAEGDRRNELLQLLLEGYDESNRRAASLLRGAGYLAQRQAYCVIAVRDVNPIEMDNRSRVQRIQESLRTVLAGLPVRLLVGERDNTVVAVVSATRRLSGWTAPHTVVSELVSQPLRTMGNAVLIGISTDVPSGSHIPRALREAKQALEIASVSQRVVAFAGVPFTRMMVRLARDQQGTSLPAWTDALLAADRRGKLVDTLRAYADNDMNVLRTAAAMQIHGNTIYARMQKIEDVTGLNPRRYHALTELLLATECAQA